jgi:hypothetical protein
VFGTRSQESCAPKLQILDGSATGRTACVHQYRGIACSSRLSPYSGIVSFNPDIKRFGLDRGDNKKI